MSSSEKPYPPLISPRSPSYERAREEQRHPAAVGPAQHVAILEQLFEAEENARVAINLALQRVVDRALRATMRTSSASHSQRQARLATLIGDAGGSPPRPEECRAILAHGSEDVARAHTDEGIVAALRSVQNDLADAYSQAVAEPLLDDPQRRALIELLPK